MMTVTAETAGPLVSIALCTYEGGKYLQRQLDSILAQTFENFELVVSDDCSTDDTLHILRAAAAKDPRIRILDNSERLGVNQNFFRAFAACKGRYIAVSDQDDWWDPDKIRILLDELGEADLVYCDSALANADGEPIGMNISDLLDMQEGRNPFFFIGNNTVSGHAMLFRSSLLQAVRACPEKVFYDQWIAFFAAKRDGINYVPRPMVEFRQHAESVTDLQAAFNDLDSSDEPKLSRGLKNYKQNIEQIALLELFAPGSEDDHALALMRALSTLLAAQISRSVCFSEYQRYSRAYARFSRIENVPARELSSIFRKPRFKLALGFKIRANFERRYRLERGDEAQLPHGHHD